MESLFTSSVSQPLAARLRPATLAQVEGQGHVTGPDGLLTRLIESQNPASLIFWGPPGVGKTTLARLYAQAFGARFVGLSAVLAGLADVRAVVAEAQAAQGAGQRTVLFVDEIHRFNKGQQDAFLPHVESGLLVLVGATTENPSFALNGALLSRCQVVVLHPLEEAALGRLLARAEEAVGHSLPLTAEARAHVLALAQGDARYLLNLADMLAGLPATPLLDVPALTALLPQRQALYDAGGDQHYNAISALHKCVRGSDPDAALYYLARMVEGGEDLLFIARRIIRMASEDVGNADPQALPLAVAARDAVQMLGKPEAELMLAQAVIYMALAPKSNATYTAWKAAQRLASATTHLPPPHTILNAPTAMMKQQGYGADYVYDHDAPEAFSGQNYWPEGVKPTAFYVPVARGFEREMQKRVSYFSKLRKERQKG